MIITLSGSSLKTEGSSDPNELRGISCCPGVVEGVVRVVKTVEEAKVLLQ